MQCSSRRRRTAPFYLKGARFEATLRENAKELVATTVSRYNKYRFGRKLLKYRRHASIRQIGRGSYRLCANQHIVLRANNFVNFSADSSEDETMVIKKGKKQSDNNPMIQTVSILQRDGST